MKSLSRGVREHPKVIEIITHPKHVLWRVNATLLPLPLPFLLYFFMVIRKAFCHFGYYITTLFGPQ
jgi:hypothetical protein